MIYYAPGKKAARVSATPQIRATNDQLYAGLCRAMLRYCGCVGEGPARPELMTAAIADYLARKHGALKAAYFRRSYGRDFWTGLPSRERISSAFAAAYRCGFDDELSGAPSTSAPRIHTSGAALGFYERGRRDALAGLVGEAA